MGRDERRKSVIIGEKGMRDGDCMSEQKYLKNIEEGAKAPAELPKDS